MFDSSSCVWADWPAPPRIKALTTTRRGGVSAGPYASANYAAHCGDDIFAVRQNRSELRERLRLPGEPLWLQQVHGNTAVEHDESRREMEADASWTDQAARVCAIMTADCLPVLFCDRSGSWIAAAHAGWRGLAGGILESTIAHYPGSRSDLLVWLGPAIGSQAFEVGDDVRQSFAQQHTDDGAAFRPRADGKFLADIYLLARMRLQRMGLEAIYGGGRCTYTETALFYSYRRERDTGRMVSLIWREEQG